MAQFTFIDLFAGIGGFHLALKSQGGRCVFVSELDKDCQKVYKTNHKQTPVGDITQIAEASIPKHDVLCAGFPCQAFSVSGKQKGFEDSRGTLFFDILRIAKLHRPKILFLENVKNFKKHDSGRTFKVVEKSLQEIGYDVYAEVLRSSDYGVPQARERFYIVAFRKDLKVKNFKFPATQKENLVVKDILLSAKETKDLEIKRNDIVLKEPTKKPKDTRKPCQIGYINKGGQGERIYSVDSVGITLSAFGGGAASKTGAYLVKGKIRRLHPRECARLQGYPDSFILPENKNTAYRQFGNSVSVPVLKAIFKEVLKTKSLNGKAAERKDPAQLELNL